MKNKVILLVLLAAVAYGISSCASSKYGCPNSTQRYR